MKLPFNLETIKSLLHNMAEKPELFNSEGSDEQFSQNGLPVRGLSELYVPEQSGQDESCDIADILHLHRAVCNGSLSSSEFFSRLCSDSIRNS